VTGGPISFAGWNLLVVADLALEDVNPSSATFAQFVSPRDYEGQISAWFFGHSS
jgi:hypothetical protein